MMCQVASKGFRRDEPHAPVVPEPVLALPGHRLDLRVHPRLPDGLPLTWPTPNNSEIRRRPGIGHVRPPQCGALRRRHGGGRVARRVKSYMVGFVLSIVLTAIPFGLVMDGHYGLPPAPAAAILGVRAAAGVVHVVFFLHMDRSAEQRWNVLAFSSRADPGDHRRRLHLDHAQRDDQHGTRDGADQLRRRDSAEVSRSPACDRRRPAGRLFHCRARPLPRAAHDSTAHPRRARLRAGPRLRRRRGARAGRARARAGPGARKSSIAIPALEIVTFDLLLSNFNRATSGSHDYDVSWHSIEHNLRGPWVVDNDPFSVNQFAHPYQGSLYHGYRPQHGPELLAGVGADLRRQRAGGRSPARRRRRPRTTRSPAASPAASSASRCSAWRTWCWRPQQPARRLAPVAGQRDLAAGGRQPPGLRLALRRGVRRPRSRAITAGCTWAAIASPTTTSPAAHGVEDERGPGRLRDGLRPAGQARLHVQPAVRLLQLRGRAVQRESASRTSPPTACCWATTTHSATTCAASPASSAATSTWRRRSSASRRPPPRSAPCCSGGPASEVAVQGTAFSGGIGYAAASSTAATRLDRLPLRHGAARLMNLRVIGGDRVSLDSPGARCRWAASPTGRRAATTSRAWSRR